MGLLDNKITTTYAEGLINLQDFYQLLEEKLGKKYKVKFLKKGNVLQQMGGAQNTDQILIAKNAYHRTLISVIQTSKQPGVEKDETLINFNRATLKWWLKMLYSRAGFIGIGIIRLCYGSNKVFDGDILDALKTKYVLKNREQNVGISALWKKNNTRELD